MMIDVTKILDEGQKVYITPYAYRAGFDKQITGTIVGLDLHNGIYLVKLDENSIKAGHGYSTISVLMRDVNELREEKGGTLYHVSKL